MQLISKHSKESHFLCVIGIYSKYAWVVPLEDRKCIQHVLKENLLLLKNLSEL